MADTVGRSCPFNSAGETGRSRNGVAFFDRDREEVGKLNICPVWEIASISNVEKIGTQVGHTCVGAFALMLGDPSGGTLAGTGLAGLAAIGAALRGRSTRRVCSNAQARAVDALTGAPEFASVNTDRLLVLLESDTSPFTRLDLIEASRAASDLDLDAALARRVHRALPFDGDDKATRQLLLLTLEAGMRACHADESFKAEVAAVQLLHLVQEVDRVHQKIDRLMQSAVAGKARELHLTEQLFISLAKRIATSVADIDQAHRELERVVEVAAEEQAKDALPANTDEAVRAVLARVDALNAEGRIDTAATLIAEEEARAEVGLFRLYDKGIAQAVLTRDADTACDYELKKLSFDTSEPAVQLEALRRIQSNWYERGRDQGLNFDLEVAIAMARAAHDRARDANERGTAGIDLGNALWTLGERESGTARLEEAVIAFRAALEEYTRKRVPLGWAVTQNNLGNALQTLGARESGTARLEEAVTAFRAALEERSRERVPLDWAATQNNLGTALWTLGARESGTARLEEAVTAFRAALEEYTRERVPLDWAMTQNNLGTALSTLGARESGTARLEEAVIAFRAALEERSRERVPLDWAMTKENLALAEKAFAEHQATAGPLSHLQTALTHVESALEVFDADASPFNHAKATGLRDDLRSCLSGQLDPPEVTPEEP